jgi:predicted pyridoxine 5'-phosphate oxidase superfamily flavin-nucleotide-binding protein
VGLLFLVPGIDETLRVNGAARLREDAAALAPFARSKRPPRLAIEVTVAEAYLHCAKAFMRSRLWDPASRVERSALPSMGEMIRDQSGSTGPAETQAEMVERYKALL